MIYNPDSAVETYGDIIMKNDNNETLVSIHDLTPLSSDHTQDNLENYNNNYSFKNPGSTISCHVLENVDTLN